MPCVACTYMPNASWRRRGGKAQGEGYLPSGAKRRTSEAKVCTSAARKTVGKPLAPRQGSALSEVWFPYSCASSAQELSGSRCGRNRPLWWEAENAQAVGARGGDLLPHSHSFQKDWLESLYVCRRQEATRRCCPQRVRADATCALLSGVRFRVGVRPNTTGLYWTPSVCPDGTCL
jgi:hypothetical protein